MNFEVYGDDVYYGPFKIGSLAALPATQRDEAESLLINAIDVEDMVTLSDAAHRAGFAEGEEEGKTQGLAEGYEKGLAEGKQNVPNSKRKPRRRTSRDPHGEGVGASG